jgi:DnaJ-class molecular chaperone
MLRSTGITRLHSTAQGNQIVHLKIEIPKSISARQEELLREFDEETKACGNGISGKLAEAVGSAFSSLFGSKKDEKKKAEKKKDKKKKDEKAKKEKDDQKDDDDDEDTKKQAAQ